MTEDALGPTGNTRTPCVFCGDAHHPLRDCCIRALKCCVHELQAEVKNLRTYLLAIQMMAPMDKQAVTSLCKEALKGGEL